MLVCFVFLLVCLIFRMLGLYPLFLLFYCLFIGLVFVVFWIVPVELSFLVLHLTLALVFSLLFRFCSAGSFVFFVIVVSFIVVSSFLFCILLTIRHTVVICPTCSLYFDFLMISLSLALSTLSP